MHVRSVRMAGAIGLSVVALVLGSANVHASGENTIRNRSVGSGAGDTAGQCAKPLAERTGGWSCPKETAATPAESLRKLQAELGKDKVSDADIAEVAAASGWCTVEGCWTQVDAYRTSFSLSSGAYGYGRTPLGTMSFSFKTVTAGTKFTVYSASFKTNSRGNRQGWINREILYLSAAYPGGNSQSPRQFSVYSDPDNIQSAGVWLTAPDKSWYQTVQQPTAAVEVGWHDPSSAYPGEWYVYAKSIKYKRQTNSTYTTQGTSVPSDEAGAGWQP